VPLRFAYASGFQFSCRGRKVSEETEEKVDCHWEVEEDALAGRLDDGEETRA
jgi:hypothetical protein